MTMISVEQLRHDVSPVHSETSPKKFDLVAFYLPQFHPVPENDRWWGAGYTEWSAVTRAQPQFQGHYQPRLPGDLGFYDLRLPDTQLAQVALAEEYGVAAFCFYYYWFGGRRILEKPLELYVNNQEICFPFCLCWANENWTRSWDGGNHYVLLRQRYDAVDMKAFANDVVPYFRDPRYYRVDGRPMFLVYRIDDIPEYPEVIRAWREIWHSYGLGDVYLAAVLSFGHSPGDPKDAGLDAYVEFPPHGNVAAPITGEFEELGPSFKGNVYSYDNLVSADLGRKRSVSARPIHRGVMMGWDNSPRRRDAANIFHGANPLKFRSWLENVRSQEEAARASTSQTVAFVNAWNEWGEGTMLEPDQRFGRGYLEAVKSVTLSPLIAINGDVARAWHGEARHGAVWPATSAGVRTGLVTACMNSS